MPAETTFLLTNNAQQPTAPPPAFAPGARTPAYDYSDPGRKDELETLLKRQGELRAVIEQTESDWLESSEQLEQAQSAS